jgi:hypothetical protein
MSSTPSLHPAGTWKLTNQWLARSAPRWARRLGWRGPFEPTHHLWSRGLALLCDHHGGLRFVRDQRGGRPALHIDPRAYAAAKDGDLLWVRATALPQFLEQVLPQLRARVVLVTGDEDWLIPGDFADAAKICASHKVLAWFAQNFDGTDRSGKIQGLPIGLDYHSISGRSRWGHRQATPQEQEAELEVLRATMPANGERLVRVHADFHFNKHARAFRGECRHAVEARLRPNPLIDFQQHKLPRLALWQEKTRYAFVVSPHGNGLDCHRTWESLLLGNIIIVKRSPLDPLYEGLPVVIVDHWGEITAENLRRWHQQHCAAFTSTEVERRLTNEYWITRMRADARRRLNGAASSSGWETHARATEAAGFAVPQPTRP